MYTPYEIITGMKPRSPIDCLLSDGSVLERTRVDKYVAELVDYLRKVHKYVDEQHSLVREKTQRAKYRELGAGHSLALGDYVMVQRAPEVGVSKRFQRPTFDQVFQVVEVHGDGQNAKAYTVSDLAGSREDLGFGQPVALDRLVPVEMLPLAHADGDQPTRILLRDRGRDRPATIQAQSMDGRVYWQYDDEEIQHCVDLASMKYQWL